MDYAFAVRDVAAYADFNIVLDFEYAVYRASDFERGVSDFFAGEDDAVGAFDCYNGLGLVDEFLGVLDLEDSPVLAVDAGGKVVAGSAHLYLYSVLI